MPLLCLTGFRSNSLSDEDHVSRKNLCKRNQIKTKTEFEKNFKPKKSDDAADKQAVPTHNMTRLSNEVDHLQAAMTQNESVFNEVKMFPVTMSTNTPKEEVLIKEETMYKFDHFGSQSDDWNYESQDEEQCMNLLEFPITGIGKQIKKASQRIVKSC